MDRRNEGWYELVTDAATAGSLYQFRINDAQNVPDPNRKSARSRAEFEHRHAVEFLSGLQFSRREVGVIGRIRKMLGLQAKRKSRFVDMAVLAGNRPIEMVPGVELRSRFCGEHS